MVKPKLKMTKIKITQVKSKIGSTQRQKKTLEALGLKKLHSSVEVEATPQIKGMVDKVSHLLNVEEV
jgi:large subunit ribosomal protein L30